MVKNKVISMILCFSIMFSVLTQSFSALGVKSLDQIDKEDFNPGPSPYEGSATSVALQNGSAIHNTQPKSLLLDGQWDMVEGGSDSKRIENLTITADSEVQPAVNVVSASTTDLWVTSNNIGTHWIQIKSAQMNVVNKFIIKHSSASDEITADYNIEISADGVNWETVVNVMDNKQSIAEYKTNDKKVRFIKLNITKSNNAKDNTARIYGIEIYHEDIKLTNDREITITADSYLGNFLPAKAIDGKWSDENNDAWISSGANKTHWLMIDFGKTTKSNNIIIKHGTLPVKDFEIQSSDDATNWSTLYTVQTNAASITDARFKEVSYRYYRLYITEPSPSDNYARIFEFEVCYDNTKILTLTEPVTVTVDSTLNNFTADKLIDGKWANQNTDEWIADGSTGSTHWAVLDFERPVKANHIVIRNDDGLRAKNYDVQCSNDCTNWTSLGSVVDNTALTTDVWFSDAEYRYFRLYITVSSPMDNYARIYEFEVRYEASKLLTKTEAVTITADTTLAGFSVSKLNDQKWNNIDTDGWVSTGAEKNHWVMLDMGKQITANQMVIRHSDLPLKDFQIQGSNDTTNWTTVFTAQINASNITDAQFNDVNFRYYRVYITDPSPIDNYARINEIELYNEVKPEVFSRKTLVKVTADSTLSTFYPENITDESWAVEETDEWVSENNTKEHWIKMDFGKAVKANRIILRHGAIPIKDFQIQCSNDNETWVDIYSKSINADAMTTANFSPRLSRYYRMYITDPAPSDNYARLYEMEVWNVDNNDYQNYIIGSVSGTDWSDKMPATIPNSVHTILYQNGKIPDPYVGFNDTIAREQSYKTWWFRKTFTISENMINEKLIFQGVADSMTVWLNGMQLGKHSGMFGGPEFDISNYLVNGENTLVVKLDPAKDYKDTVVFNNSYGWHYLDMPPLGIWQSVKIEGQASVKIIDPFVATMSTSTGTIRLSTKLTSVNESWSGKLIGTISPENFTGEPYSFLIDVTSTTKDKKILLEMDVPDPKLWWPVDYGDPNLYNLKLTFEPDGTGIADYNTTNFGIRTIEMKPSSGVERSDQYNWVFEVNGKPVFIKGTNWCTLDAMMRFSRENYDRYLTLAKQSHINFLRAWGSGMPETDDFYDLADRYGLMVLQEWPCAWDSDKVQPSDVLEETVRLNTIRIRNHPSLIMYDGGNESVDPTGPMIKMMGRYAYELDGTRPFHRAEAWGGSAHNYDVYWGKQSLDKNLTLEAPFIGEFGLASVPNYESVMRYLPDNEKNEWPLRQDGSFAHKTPTFNSIWGYGLDMSLLTKYSGLFTENTSLKNFILGSQLAQATGVRHTLENARANWPSSSGIAFYKLNDNNPASAWSTVDWFGTSKLSYSVFQDSYEPLTSIVLFKELNPGKKALELPVVIADDTDQLKNTEWKVVTRAFNEELNEIAKKEFTGSGSIDRVKQLGNLDISGSVMTDRPTLIVTEVQKDGKTYHKNYYWINYEKYQGSLFYMLPLTLITTQVESDSITVTNNGNKPAVGVTIEAPEVSDQFTAEDNLFWLDAGESRTIKVSNPNKTIVSAWNSATCNDTTPSTTPKNFIVQPQGAFGTELRWESATDAESGIRSYNVYRDHMIIAKLSSNINNFTDSGLSEGTDYTYEIEACNGDMKTVMSASIKVTTGTDSTKPMISSINSLSSSIMKISFSKPIDKATAENINNYKILPTVIITSAKLLDDGKTVEFTINGTLLANKKYSIWVSGIKDLAQIPNIINQVGTFTTNLIANWKFDNYKNLGFDYSYSNNNGLSINAKEAKGKIGRAMYTSNAEQYIEVRESNINLKDKFTIAGWIKTPSTDGFRIILSKGPKSAGHFEVYLSSSGIEFYSTELGNFATGIKVDDNTWHHYAFTYDGSKIKFYLDGTYVKEYGTTGTIVDTNEIVRINGLIGGAYPMKAYYDDTRIYNNVLDDSEIQDLFTNILRVGNLVWDDANNNGIQDEGEVGIEGVMVKLYKQIGNNWNEIQIAITDENGEYYFDEQINGEYRVEFQIPNGYQLSKANVGNDVKINSKAIVSTTNKHIGFAQVNLNSKENIYINAGFVKDGTFPSSPNSSSLSDGSLPSSASSPIESPQTDDKSRINWLIALFVASCGVSILFKRKVKIITK